MAISITTTSRTVMGNKRVRWGTGNLGTYAATGVAVTAANLGFARRIDHLNLNPVAAANAGTTGVTLKWDRANGKIQAFHADVDVAGTAQDLAEKNAVDISAMIFTWEAIGV